MKKKPRSGLVWGLFIALGIAIEIVTAFLDDVPNNSLSHWVNYTATEHPWTALPIAIIGVITLGHWVCKKWIWPPPTWEIDDEDKE